MSYDCSIDEGMNELDINPETGLPDPFLTATRGLSEELAIHLDDEEQKAICLTTLFFTDPAHEWGMFGVLDLTDPRLKSHNRLTSQQILQKHRNAEMKSKWEHTSLTFIPFTPGNSILFFKS